MAAIDPGLLDLIACPCPAHARLDVVAEGLRCTSCGRIFPIRDGIPVLLLSDALTGPDVSGPDMAGPAATGGAEE